MAKSRYDKKEDYKSKLRKALSVRKPKAKKPGLMAKVGRTARELVGGKRTYLNKDTTRTKTVKSGLMKNMDRKAYSKLRRKK